jgi:hypothetical protein
LFVFEGVVDGRGADQFQLPREAFAHTDPSAIVKLEARQVDGEPLPGWLQFNTVTGQFLGTPPPGFSSGLDVQVTARDAEGREASVAFKLELGTLPSASSQPAAPGATPGASAPTGTGTPEGGANTSGLGSDGNRDLAVLGAASQPGVGTPGVALGGSNFVADQGPISAGTPGAPATAGSPESSASAESGFPLVRVTEVGGIAVPVSISDIQARLFVYQGVRDAIGFDQFQVPREAFAHTDSSAFVRLSARTVSGEPLPSWLSFDAINGVFQGLPPGGVSISLDLILTAQDSNGREASFEFKLELGVKDSGEGAPKPIRAGSDPLLSGIDDADINSEEDKEAAVLAALEAKLLKEQAVKAEKQAQKRGATSFADQIRAAKASKDPVLAKVLDSKLRQVNRIGS